MSDLLVVASKVKQYIKQKSEMNTSASIMQSLTQIVQKALDQAIEHAQNDGRKTVMDRDLVSS